MQEDAGSSWFTDFEDDPDVDEIKTEVQRTFDRAEAVAAERTRVEREKQERAEARARSEGAPDAIRLKAEARVGALRDEVAQIEAAHATTRAPELLTERELVMSELRGRERALSFANRSDAELQDSVEPLEVRIEEAREKMQALPEDSTRGKIAKRDYTALLNEREALAIERRARIQRTNLVAHRERRIHKDAFEAIRKQREDKIDRMLDERKTDGVHARRKLDLEVQYLRGLVREPPTEEQLAAMLPSAAAAYDARIEKHVRQNARQNALLPNVR